jgi:hypothetical protein
MDDRPVLIPIDPRKRAELMDLACLTAEERQALDLWCYQQAQERARGILFYQGEPRSPVPSFEAMSDWDLMRRNRVRLTIEWPEDDS